MRVISKRPLREFWSHHPESRAMLEDWYHKARQVSAASFTEVKQAFASADYVDGVTIFDIGGNRYRLAAVIHYNTQRIYVRHVMTHADYDRNRWRKR